LYARLLGARKVIAVDNDIDTILSVKKNLSFNQAHDIELACTDLQNIRGIYDIVLANLDITTFSNYSEKISSLVAKDGHLIISGILGRDKKRVIPLFHPFVPVQITHNNSWQGIVFNL
jgi:ribosomal protein L11 methyltransferase